MTRYSARPTDPLCSGVDDRSELQATGPILPTRPGPAGNRPRPTSARHHDLCAALAVSAGQSEQAPPTLARHQPTEHFTRLGKRQTSRVGGPARRSTAVGGNSIARSSASYDTSVGSPSGQETHFHLRSGARQGLPEAAVQSFDWACGAVEPVGEVRGASSGNDSRTDPSAAHNCCALGGGTA
jgi:hypothetical protein